MDIEIIRRLGLESELDLPAIIRLFGIEKVLQAISQDETLRTMYLKKIIQTMSPKEIIQTLGVENLLETLFPNLTDEERETLERMRQRRQGTSPASTTNATS